MQLRPVADGDLPIFFEQQLDTEANHMAAFASADPTNRADFDAHWHKVRADEHITVRTVVYEGQVSGYIVVHRWFGEPEVGYWFGKSFWGNGIATLALKLLLDEVDTRPLAARVVADNVASKRVLEKCGFVISRSLVSFAPARGKNVTELILTLS